MSCFIVLSIFIFYFQSSNLIFSLSLFFFFLAVGRPSLRKFHSDHVNKARLHVDRSFHSLVNLQRLVTWGLSPELVDE